MVDPTSDDEVLLFTGRKGARRSKGRPSALARMVEEMAGAAVVPGLSTGNPLSRGGSRGAAVGGGGSDGGGRGGRGFAGRGGQNGKGGNDGGGL